MSSYIEGKKSRLRTAERAGGKRVQYIAEAVRAVNSIVNDFIWGPVMLVFFLLTGIMFTLRTGFFQIRYLRLWLRTTLGSLGFGGKARKSGDAQAISQFQSACTALAGTMGTGNIAGVATAIVSGGPGAVFWMWVSAFFGMMTSYAEKVLGIMYRYREKDGSFTGSAMVYMERGLHCKGMAVMYAACCALASFGIGNMTQANSIAEGLQGSFGIPPRLTAICVIAFTGVVIIGGIKRIANVAEKLIPSITIIYIVGALTVIVTHASEMSGVCRLIVSEAFQVRSAVGGALGYGMARAMKTGISRGVFSNEAGLGSSVAVHAASDVSEPVIQGMWGIFEVFADTIVVCTLTAFVILTSGVYDMQDCLTRLDSGIRPVNGTLLTGAAFESVIPFGSGFVALAIVLFACATLISWSYYGERAVVYLFGKWAVLPYKLLFLAVIYVGCVSSLELVWEVSDTLNGFMALPNLAAVILLSGQVVAATKKYLRGRR